MSGVFSLVDGRRLPCADYIHLQIQTGYYNGYTGNVEVTYLLVYSFFGEVIHSAVNYTGSWHEKRLALTSGLYHQTLNGEYTTPVYSIVVDSTFAGSAMSTNGKLARGI